MSYQAFCTDEETKFSVNWTTNVSDGAWAPECVTGKFMLMPSSPKPSLAEMEWMAGGNRGLCWGWVGTSRHHLVICKVLILGLPVLALYKREDDYLSNEPWTSSWLNSYCDLQGCYWLTSSHQSLASIVGYMSVWSLTPKWVMCVVFSSREAADLKVLQEQQDVEELVPPWRARTARFALRAT